MEGLNILDTIVYNLSEEKKVPVIKNGWSGKIYSICKLSHKK